MKTTVALTDWDADIAGYATRIAAAGFSRVVLSVEDRHVLYRGGDVIDAVDILKSKGLEVHLDPWGIKGFAGESISHPLAFYEWLKLAVQTNADALLLDEPTHHLRLGMDEIFAAVEKYTPECKLHMAVEPQYLTQELYDRVDEVSLSGYLFGKQMSRATPTSVESQVDDWYDNLNGLFGSAWIQLFDIPQGKEWVPAALINLWNARGVDVNIWAWEGAEGRIHTSSHNSALVWAHTMSALEIIRQQ